MKVFKFGGASIETAERAKYIADIILDYNNENLMLVFSAMGKTTNALEQITQHFFNNEKEKAIELFEKIKSNHLNYAAELLAENNKNLEDVLQVFFNEIEIILNQKPTHSYDYYYDQIVSSGELWSSTILSFYLNKKSYNATWVDVRGIIKTDDNYRDATINWQTTSQNVENKIIPLFENSNILITQGFIGSTNENNSVTLGREGSDYTAAVFTNLLNAGSLTIWKDVQSLLNADPKIFPNTIPIDEITFHEVIEMAYYGAQVIHPKTIKPLHNKNIPLYVKCFLDKYLKGTLIHNTEKKIKYPPILVLKSKQILLEVTTKDYSFITEDNLSTIYKFFHDCKIKINLIQNAAISFVACIDSHVAHLDELLHLLHAQYEVKRNEDLFLFTVRHYTQDVLKEELKDRTVLLTQKTRETIQMVVR